MLSQMRKRVKVIMLIVAVSFVAGFLLNELWQMLRMRTGGRQSYWEKGIFGKVGKKTITRDEYQNTLDYFTYKLLREKKVRDLSETERENLHTQVWQYLINEKVWADVLKQEKIKVTDAEIYEIMKNNPPPELREHPELMTEDGKFDQEKYLNVMANPDNRAYFMVYARDLVDMLPKEKLRIDISSLYRVTSGEIHDQITLENTWVKATYLYFSPRVVKEQYTPTENEIKEYYEKNIKEYEIQEMRPLRYVFFPLHITAEDSLDAQRQIEDAYSMVKPEEEFSLLIKDFSDNPEDTAAIWFEKMSLDARTQSVIDSLKIGAVSKPFLSDSGWQILSLEEKKER